MLENIMSGVVGKQCENAYIWVEWIIFENIFLFGDRMVNLLTLSF